MNVYTLLGAALCDERIRELLFKNPLEAAQELGLLLTHQELIALKAFLSADDFEEQFEDLARKQCPHPPCPLNLARPDHGEESLSSAAD